MPTASLLEANIRRPEQMAARGEAEQTHFRTAEPDLPVSRSLAPLWPAVAFGAAAAIGVAWAAALVTIKGADRDVGIAAWVAVAVVGASATIATASGPQPRRPIRARRLRRLARLARKGKLAMPG